MKKEAHKACCENRVTEPEVPRSPLRLQPVKLAEVSVGVQHLGGGVRRGGRVHFVGRRDSRPDTLRSTSSVGEDQDWGSRRRDVRRYILCVGAARVVRRTNFRT